MGARPDVHLEDMVEYLAGCGRGIIDQQQGLQGVRSDLEKLRDLADCLGKRVEQLPAGIDEVRAAAVRLRTELHGFHSGLTQLAQRVEVQRNDLGHLSNNIAELTNDLKQSLSKQSHSQTREIIHVVNTLSSRVDAQAERMAPLVKRADETVKQLNELREMHEEHASYLGCTLFVSLGVLVVSGVMLLGLYRGWFL